MTNDMHRLGDVVDDAVAELLDLYPQLGHALARDAGAADGERVSTSVVDAVLPVNLDVLAAVKMLREETWKAAAGARVWLAEPADMISVEATIESCGVLFRRLVGRGFTAQAGWLARAVLHWHRTAREAIGLSTRARPLRGDGRPVTCPLHDDPITQLHQAGDEGRVDAGAAGEREAITWQRGGGLYCPHCGGSWGPSEYAFLGRLVGEQRLRLMKQRRGDAA